MKGRIITIVLACCMLSFILVACGNGPNDNGGTPSPSISGGNATASPSPSPGSNPSSSPSAGTASPSADTDGTSPSAEISNNVYVGIVKSIDGDQIDLTSEGLDDVTAAENDTKTKTITVDDSIPIVKQGVSTDAKIKDIKKGDVLIVTLDAGKLVNIYDYGPLED